MHERCWATPGIIAGLLLHSVELMLLVGTCGWNPHWCRCMDITQSLCIHCICGLICRGRWNNRIPPGFCWASKGMGTTYQFFFLFFFFFFFVGERREMRHAPWHWCAVCGTPVRLAIGFFCPLDNLPSDLPTKTLPCRLSRLHPVKKSWLSGMG